jgi:hypothetical protein
MKQIPKLQRFFSGRKRVRDSAILFLAAVIIIGPLGCKTIYQPTFVPPTYTSSVDTITLPCYFATTATVAKWLASKDKNTITFTLDNLKPAIYLDSSSLLLSNIYDKPSGYSSFPDTLNFVNYTIPAPQSLAITYTKYSISNLELKIKTLRKALDSVGYISTNDQLVFEPFITMDSKTKICYLDYEVYMYASSSVVFSNILNNSGGSSAPLKMLFSPTTTTGTPVVSLNPSPPAKPQ